MFGILKHPGHRRAAVGATPIADVVLDDIEADSADEQPATLVTSGVLLALGPPTKAYADLPLGQKFHTCAA